MLLWLKDWGTLLIALWGACLSTWVFVVSRRDAKRARLADAPWTSLAVTNGDANSRMVKATFWNPSLHEIDLDTVEVLQPKGWRVVPWLVDPNGGTFADTSQAGRRIKLLLRLATSLENRAKPAMSQIFIVATPDWQPSAIAEWPGGTKHVEPVAVALAFRGHARSADREPIEMRASA